MIVNGSNLVPKSSNKYCCYSCDYTSFRKSHFDRHLSTDKHKKMENDSKMIVNDSDLVPKRSKVYKCECGKIYKYDSGYYRHKKICKYNEKQPITLNLITPELVMELIKDNKEMKQVILEQNNTINNLVKNGVSNINNNITNSLNNTNNKTFNLQFFLNETCKDAMNIMDFVDSIKLQLSDLEKVGEIGYVEGITNIIVDNLKSLDITQRPVHCTDKKREVLYIKDENKWTKEDEEKNKLRNVIKRVAHKNIRMLPQFRVKYPDCNKSISRYSDQYNKIVVEAMGGSGNNDTEKEDKIIKNITKNVMIDK